MTVVDVPPFFPHSGVYGDEPFPAWVEGFRPWQWRAAQEIVQTYEQGMKIVVLDAPTGSGKTLIAEMVARILQVKRAYVCSDKGLQTQFAHDFPDSRVLMGRSNYDTLQGDVGVTAADCNSDGSFCTWCSGQVTMCPYNIAKREAFRAQCAVLNTSYLLTEANGPGQFAGRELCVVDEADTLEQQLMGHVTFELSERMADGLALAESVPVKGSHMPTIVRWLRDALVPAARMKLNGLRGESVAVIRERKRLANLIDSAMLVAKMLDEHASAWVRDNNAFKKPLVLRPIVVDQLADRHLWQHADKWLLMSATVVSADEMMSSLGKERHEYHVVHCPMTFPLENRRVVVAPVADMSNKAKEWDAGAKAVVNICKAHSGQRVLVHGVSYALTKHIVDSVHAHTDRPVFSHEKADGKALAVERYRARDNSVLVSPSLERGLDLRGDDCRVIVICKVPFPYLGDAQVNARMHRGREGSTWYTVQAIRLLVQMTGRGVRSADDWALGYILDRNFVSNIWRNHKHLLPAWWTEALDMKSDTRWLLGTM